VKEKKKKKKKKKETEREEKKNNKKSRADRYHGKGEAITEEQHEFQKEREEAKTSQKILRSPCWAQGKGKSMCS
jgi:hypothetical protein